ncbi:MAG TPA: TRAP transporter small permease subunit [Syntrophorhabdales bacterium]|nr:TRAP transporter small permease subunit [Syntrophorhabdales bacterium]
MSPFRSVTSSLSRFMNYAGGIVLVFMMLLVVSDVILRIFWKPILGTYEMVSLAGALVIGFAIPKTSLDDAHVYVDFVVTGRSAAVRKAFLAVTKFLGFVLFLLLAINMFRKAGELYSAQEVTLTLHIPLYPVAYALAFCSIVEAIVLLLQIYAGAGKEGGNE